MTWYGTNDSWSIGPAWDEQARVGHISNDNTTWASAPINPVPIKFQCQCIARYPLFDVNNELQSGEEFVVLLWSSYGRYIRMYKYVG